MSSPDDVWSALSHPARRVILDRLRAGPALTGELASLLDAHDRSSRFATLRHLKTLRDAGLVITEESGRERRNHLNGSALYQATIGWLDPPSRASAGRLSRLKSVLETPAPSAPAPKESSTMTEFRTFDIAQEIDIAATPDRVWQALTGDVGGWWGSPYLLIERPGSELHVDPVIGAPVVESNAGEQRVWGSVSSLKEGELLGWTGPMGMGELAWGTVEFSVTATDDGSRVRVTQASFGAFGEAVAAGYSHGWDDLLHRLRTHLVDGVDYGINGLNRSTEDFAAAT